VDQSGLTGRYDFTLKLHAPCGYGGASWWPPRPAGNNLDAAPDRFGAFQQHLELKLEPTRVPVDVMVIDKVPRPSEN
jgi:uncharacterized protein (TIGR03435 family)